jgi:hypothetical protein
MGREGIGQDVQRLVGWRTDSTNRYYYYYYYIILLYCYLYNNILYYYYYYYKIRSGNCSHTKHKTQTIVIS